MEAIKNNNRKFTDDECFRHVVMRCLSACHAMWQILGYHQYSSSPAVSALSIHLPMARNVVWKTFGNKKQNNLQKANEVLENTSSSLQKYFLRPANKVFEDIKFLEYFDKYIIQTKPFKNTNRIHWIDRTIQKRFVAERKMKSNLTRHRMHSLLPTQGQIYFLRLLLQEFPARYGLALIHL